MTLPFTWSPLDELTAFAPQRYTSNCFHTLTAVPPLIAQEIIKDEQKWAKLGVVLPGGDTEGPFFSEVGMLRLVPPQLAGGTTPAAPSPASQRGIVRPSRRETAEPVEAHGSRSGGTETAESIETVDSDGAADERAAGVGSPEGDEEAWRAVAPAKPSEEIWERHGWDSMDGSWKGFPF